LRAPGVAALLPAHVPLGDRQSRIAFGAPVSPCGLGVASLLPAHVPPGDRQSRIAFGAPVF